MFHWEDQTFDISRMKAVSLFLVSSLIKPLYWVSSFYTFHILNPFNWLTLADSFFEPGGLRINPYRTHPYISFRINVTQGNVDGSASKPALRQDTDYMVEKTYLDIAPYLWAFGGLFTASVTQIWFKRCFHIQKRSLDCGGQLTVSSIWSKNH